MHHNRSLLPDVEVFLGVIVKTSKLMKRILILTILNSDFHTTETPTQWKSESVTLGLTDQLTRVGARDTYASKKGKYAMENFTLKRPKDKFDSV